MSKFHTSSETQSWVLIIKKRKLEKLHWSYLVAFNLKPISFATGSGLKLVTHWCTIPSLPFNTQLKNGFFRFNKSLKKARTSHKSYGIEHEILLLLSDYAVTVSLYKFWANEKEAKVIFPKTGFLKSASSICQTFLQNISQVRLQD